MTQTAPATPDTTKPATTMPQNDAQAPAPAPTTTAAPGRWYLTEQSADQISAKTYMGQSVYNGQNESIGSINDLVSLKQGGVIAAVVGVGGFLGIGQKNVAVPFDKIDLAQNAQDGTIKLTTTETADSAEGRTEFKTLAMQALKRPHRPPGNPPRCLEPTARRPRRRPINDEGSRAISKKRAVFAGRRFSYLSQR